MRLRDQRGIVWMPVVFIVIALVFGTAIVYMLATQTGISTTNINTTILNANTAANLNATGVLGGDRDEHGCIGSAGYSWCAAKQKCLRTWEEDCTAPSTTNSSTNTNSATTTDTSTPIVSTANWNTYTNADYDYQIRYPENFYDRTISGIPGTDHYFANERVDAPLAMSANGIWITVRVAANPSAHSVASWAAGMPDTPVGTVIRNVQTLTVDGYAAVQQDEDFTQAEGTSGGYALVTYIAYAGRIYSVTAGFHKDTMESFRLQYEAMVTSLNFTDGTANE